MNEVGEQDGEPSPEEFIYRICRDSYLADYVVPSPRYNKAGAGEKEAADLLLPFERGVLALQVKSRTIAAAADPLSETELGRIEKRVKEAVGQVRSVIAARDGGHLQEVETLSGIRRPLSEECLRNPIGIAVLEVRSESGEPLDEYELHHGIAKSGGIDVHIFLRSDFEVIVAELDTIPDLVSYLELRKALLERKILIPGWSEQSLLTTFVTQHDQLTAALATQGTSLVLLETRLEEVREKFARDFERRDALRSQSRFFDDLIARCRESIGFDPQVGSSLAGRSSEKGTAANYATIADALSTFTRAERVVFASRVEEKARKADSADVPFAYFAQASSRSRVMVVFLASRKGRKERFVDLERVCTAAYVQKHGDRVVGVAAPNLSANSGSIDFFYMGEGLEFENEVELRDLAQKVFKPAADCGTDEWQLGRR